MQSRTRNLRQAGAALGVAALLGIAGATGAQASLMPSYQFQGTGNWSLDAVGGGGTPVGTVDAVVPTGSTVEQAFLYSSMFVTGTTPSVDFDGTVISGASWTSLGTAAGFLEAYRADVTAQVAAKVGGGGILPYSFSINSENPNGSIDGEVLAVVYSNPAELTRTIAFLDGASSTTGDSFTFNLAAPLDNTIPGFEALMSLGIGFGFQGTDQASQVDVNGQRLTSSAGGQDDGDGTGNGSLITVGGLGDSTANPANPFAGPNGDPRLDDELYDLANGGFLTFGDTQIMIDTLNPSDDDNIFFTGFNITAEGTFEEMPEPATLAIFGLGLAGLGVIRRRRRAA